MKLCASTTLARVLGIFWVECAVAACAKQPVAAPPATARPEVNASSEEIPSEPEPPEPDVEVQEAQAPTLPLAMEVNSPPESPSTPRPSKETDPPPTKPIRSIRRDSDVDCVVFSPLPEELRDIEGRNRKIRFKPESSDVLLPGSIEEIDRIAAVLRRYPGICVTLDVHIFSTPARERYGDFGLTERRARYIKHLLAERSIDPRHVFERAVGANEPIDTNKTARGRANNTHVNLRVIGAAIPVAGTELPVGER